MFDIKLITFINVARIKNYTKAGEILNLTQPAVSQHIKFLEDFYEVTLIKKKGKSIALTEEGKILLSYAEKLEIIYRNLEMELRNKNNINKTYMLGASMTIGGYVLPYILAEHKKIYKNMDILLHVNNTEDIIDKLLKGKIDFALVEGIFDKNKFQYRKLQEDELVLAVSYNHIFASKESVTIDEVLEGNLILREKGSGTREIFEKKVLEKGYQISDIKPYMELGSITAIKSLVEENLGYTIISKETIRREVERKTIKVIPIKDLKIYRDFNFIYLKDINIEFIEHFIDFCLRNNEIER